MPGFRPSGRAPNRPLGCLSGVALMASLLTSLAAVASAVATDNQIFSPGELRSMVAAEPLGGVLSHAELECRGCHVPPWSLQPMGEKCLDCHTEVRAEMGDASSLHGDGFATSRNCRKCHTEHAGPAASLTRYDGKDIRHDRFGFSLQAHEVKFGDRLIDCQDCHTESLRTFDVVPCVVCHLEIDGDWMSGHLEDYGYGCLGCHDGVDSYGSKFDHLQVVFPLEGRHQQVRCSGCHPGATTITALREVPQECEACHGEDDVHEGRLGPNCAGCHSAAGWDQILTFDHGLTGFSLVGSHVVVLCAQCHVNGRLAGIPKECVACHIQDDVHVGRLGTLCGECHDPRSWDQVDLILFDHNLTGFPLTGAHRAATCQTCHGSDLLASLPADCVGCHSQDDIHDRRLGLECQQCHSTASWSELDLSAFDHDLTGFELLGSHLTTDCQSCHVGGRLTGLPRDCIGCHSKDDIHLGQLGPVCADCHVPSAWMDLSRFDHSRTPFPLTGAHATVSCDFCHLGDDFHEAPTTCFACHGEPPVHRGLFGTACADCHTTAGWVPAEFGLPHGFPLNHGGAESNCSFCHTVRMQEYTCFECHDQIDTAEFHAAIGISDLSSCADCHPGGKK